MNPNCGCCEGVEAITPLAIYNRPGLEAIAYRIGVHSSFLSTMLARLASHRLPADPLIDPGEAPTSPLLGLMARSDDASIALLDAWALVGDVLTFYQERIANEGYLRTAVERRSILELARLVGYRLRPGVASSVFLAYLLDKPIGPETQVKILKGSRVQSVPGPGEKAQPFETFEDAEAYYRWNNLQPRLTQPSRIFSNTVGDLRELYLEGANSGLRSNDPLLLVFKTGDPALLKIKTVEADALKSRTRLELQDNLFKMRAAAFDAFRRETLAQVRSFRAERVTGATADNVDESILAALEARFNEAHHPSEITSAIRGRLPELQARLADAEARRQTRLGPWLKTIVDGLGARLNEADAVLAGADFGGAALPIAAFADAASRGRARRASLALPSLHVNCVSRDSAVTFSADNLPADAKFSVLIGPMGMRGVNGQEVDTLDTGMGGTVTFTASLPKGLKGANRLALRIQNTEGMFAYTWFENKETCLEGGASGPVGLSVSQLEGLVGALKKARSIPPFQSRELARKPDELYGRGTDLAVQILGALNPALKQTIYTAWSNAQVGIPAALDALQALRVKAQPFGATAPLKPVLDDDGAVVGAEEWPLGTIQLLRFRMLQGPFGHTPIATISLLKAGAAAQHTEPLLTAHESTFDLGGTRVKVSYTTEPQFALVFTFPDGREYKLAWLAFEAVTVTVPEGEWIVSPGDVLPPFQAGGRLFRIVFRSLADGTVSILTFDEASPEPVDGFGRRLLPLDSKYEQITPGSWVAVERAGTDIEPIYAQVLSAETVAQTAFGISASVTRLTLDRDWVLPSDRLLSDIRGVTVYAQGETLPLAWEPITADVGGAEIELDSVYPGLQSGRWVIVSGERTDIPDTSGVPGVELAMLSGVIVGSNPSLSEDPPHTIITLAKALAYTYKRETVKIYGNVIKATHGETRSEVLGSGSGGQALQTFELRASPLTYLAAPNPLGAESTLEVRANEVRWQEADNLILLAARDHGYMTRTGDDDKTRVIFGDGVHGARLPTGSENIRAVYRTGIGRVGNVRAGTLTQLLTRPLGASGVINPLPATGGADREGRDSARRNAPLGVLALDRLVSVQDYADFTRTRAGIGKALAAYLPDGARRIVHLTIAGSDDIPIDPGSDLMRNLRLSLQENGDPSQAVQIAVRELAVLILTANIRVHPNYLWEVVEPNVRQALLDRYSFDHQELGDDVLLSEIIALIQNIPGVDYVDVDGLALAPESITPDTLEALADSLALPPDGRLTVEVARPDRVDHTAFAGQTLNGLAGEYGVSVSDLLRLNPTWQADDPLPAGEIIRIFSGIRPAQLALFDPALPDTLILTEVKV